MPAHFICRITSSSVAVLVAGVVVAAAGCGDDDGTISGRVVPVSSLATVAVFADGTPMAEVRVNTRTGDFEVDVPGGTYDLVFTAQGYLNNVDHADVVVRGGAAADLGVVTLFRAGSGSIHGSVVPETAPAVVSAVQLGTAISQTEVDDKGQFFLTDLPVGVYDLVITARGFERDGSRTGIRVVEAKVSEVEPVMLRPSSLPPGSLRGVVAPAAARAAVAVQQQGATVATATAAAGDGSWTIEGLAPGSYNVVVSATGYGTDRSRTAVMIHPDQTTDLGTITLTMPRRTVEGLVTDAATAAPIAGARVSIGSVTDVTRGDGSFLLADAPAGDQMFKVERVYYLALQDVVTVAATGRTAHSLSLIATGRVVGAVRGSGGEPLPGAVVELGPARSTTDQQGRFHLVDLLPGRYAVRAAVTGYAAVTYQIDVRAGEEATQDFTLARAGDVSGRISNAATGAALAGAIVTANGRATASRADGTFVLSGVAAGTHTVRISAPHFVGQSRSVMVTAGQTTAANAALAPVARIIVSGRVTSAATGAAVGTAVVCAGLSTSICNSCDSDGRYSMADVPDDVTVLRVFDNEHPWRTKSVSLAGRGSSVVEDVTVLDYGQVFGRVVDAATGNGVPGIEVSCGPSAITSDDGSFLVTGVNPGAATCSFFSSCHTGAPLSIDVPSGGSAEINATVQRMADVRLHVTASASSAPLSGADLVLLPERLTAQTDGAGQVIFRCQSTGVRTIVGSANGYSSAATAVSVPASGQIEAFLALTPSGVPPGN